MVPALGIVSHTYASHTHTLYLSHVRARCQFSGWPPMIPVLGMVAPTYASNTVPIARARAVQVLRMAAHDTSSRDGRPYVRFTLTHDTYRTRARCQFSGWPPMIPVLGIVARGASFSGWPPMIPVLGMVAHTYVSHIHYTYRRVCARGASSRDGRPFELVNSVYSGES